MERTDSTYGLELVKGFCRLATGTFAAVAANMALFYVLGRLYLDGGEPIGTYLLFIASPGLAVYGGLSDPVCLAPLAAICLGGAVPQLVWRGPLFDGAMAGAFYGIFFTPLKSAIDLSTPLFSSVFIMADILLAVLVALIGAAVARACLGKRAKTT